MGSECPLCFGQEPRFSGWAGWVEPGPPRRGAPGFGRRGRDPGSRCPRPRPRPRPAWETWARSSGCSAGNRSPARRATRGGCRPEGAGGRCTGPRGRSAWLPGLAGTACAAATRPPVRVPSQEMSSYWKDRCCLLQRVAESATNLHMHLVTKNFVFVLGSVPLEPAFKKATCRVPVRK